MGLKLFEDLLDEKKKRRRAHGRGSVVSVMVMVVRGSVCCWRLDHASELL